MAVPVPGPSVKASSQASDRVICVAAAQAYAAVWEAG
jgi:hypothetical protein